MTQMISMDMIINAACVSFGVSRSDMFSFERFEEVVRAKAAVYWLARKMTTLNLTEIASALGKKDHSTAYAGASRAEVLREQDTSFRVVTDTLLATLMQLQDAGILAISASIDPLAVALRVCRAPQYEAVRVSTFEIISICQRLIDLDAYCTATQSEPETSDAA